VVSVSSESRDTTTLCIVTNVHFIETQIHHCLIIGKLLKSQNHVVVSIVMRPCRSKGRGLNPSKMPRPALSFLCKEYGALSALEQKPVNEADEIQIE
jgi:hypothetical protein